MRYASITERLAHLGSDMWVVHLRARALQQAGQEILELTIGEPDIATDPRLIDACSKAMYAGRTGYSNGRGESTLLQALSEKYSKRSGRAITAENILCFPGTQTALFATIMGLVESGDAVLVGDPLYATYDGVIQASGAQRQSVPLLTKDGFRMTAAGLEAAIDSHSRILLLNNPHNPTGAVLSRHEVFAIAEVCRQHDLWLVCDEVYEDLIFDLSFASPFDDDAFADRTIVVSSISKSHAAPGFRSGWAVGPAEFCRRLLPLSESMLFGGQPFIADMTALALTQSFDSATRMRNAYRRRAHLIVDTLTPITGLQPFMPAAGMFVLVDIQETGWQDQDFAWQLLDQEGVAVMPGTSFGQQAKGYIRLSLTVPDDIIVEACRRLIRFTERHATMPKHHVNR